MQGVVRWWRVWRRRRKRREWGKFREGNAVNTADSVDAEKVTD